MDTAPEQTPQVMLEQLVAAGNYEGVAQLAVGIDFTIRDQAFEALKSAGPQAAAAKAVLLEKLSTRISQARCLKSRIKKDKESMQAFTEHLSVAASVFETLILIFPEQLASVGDAISQLRGFKETDALFSAIDTVRQQVSELLQL